MLDFLVTSTARRRLLLLLWGEKASGSVRELAARAGVAFASAHDELREMQRRQLVVAKHDGTKEVFSANSEFHDHDVLTALAGTAMTRVTVTRVVEPEIDGRLRTLGAPLRDVKPRPLAPLTVVETLFEGARRARESATIARVMPLCVWRARTDLDARSVTAISARPEDKHALGFLMDLAGELGGDRRLSGAAEALRDHRITSTRPFFFGDTRRRTKPEFPLASNWGFELDIDRVSFASLFEKHRPT